MLTKHFQCSDRVGMREGWGTEGSFPEERR